MGEAHFQLPLNLPHAATVARRIVYHIDRACSIKPGLDAGERLAITIRAGQLTELLVACRFEEANPPEGAAQRLVAESSALARQLVDDIKRLELGDDRLGQAVRNFFECLALEEEGARISLRAGENPDSALRPQ